MEGDVRRAEERRKVRRSLVVKEKVGERVRKRAKERDNRLEGRDIGRGGAGHHGVEVDVPMVQDNEYVLVSRSRFDREAPGQIGGCPMGPVEGECVALEGGVNRGRGDRGKGRDEGSVWGCSLLAFVGSGLSGLGGRGLR